MEDTGWFRIENAIHIDSPALLIYSERMKRNVQKALEIAGHPSLLRPHVKTSKIAEVCSLMMNAGISKFKAATIAECEMLAMIGAPDVLLAYQPSAPKLERFARLINTYPGTVFSCLTDNLESAGLLSATGLQMQVFIDLNIGMNRSGIKITDAIVLAQELIKLPGIQLEGLHAYDGHIHDVDPEKRKASCEEAMTPVYALQEKLEISLGKTLKVIAGGTPTYAIQAARAFDHLRNRQQHGITECSPGTFVFWDDGYHSMLPDLPFSPAAVLLSRVISIVDEHTICTDLGHKSVASEMPFPRVSFLNAPAAISKSHSEEHMTITVSNSSEYKIGDCIYCLPKHICPTVALYEKVYVVENNKIAGEWKTIARDRYINI